MRILQKPSETLVSYTPQLPHLLLLPRDLLHILLPVHAPLGAGVFQGLEARIYLHNIGLAFLQGIDVAGQPNNNPLIEQ